MAEHTKNQAVFVFVLTAAMYLIFEIVATGIHF
jgi:hypothetical protein